MLVLLLVGCGNHVEQYWPQSLDDLKGHKVGLLEGSGQQHFLMTEYNDPDIECLCYPSRTDAITAVVQNKADVAILTESEIYDETFRRMNLTLSGKIPEVQYDIAFAVRKGNTSLTGELSQVIDSLKADGTIDDMIGRWMNPENFDYRQKVVLPPMPVQPEQTEKLLRIGIADVKPPYEVMIDNRWTGYEIELLQRFAEVYGYSLKLELYQFNNLIPALETGKIDVICSSFFVNEERMRKVDFATSHYRLTAAFCVYDRSAASKENMWSRICESVHYSLIVENRWKLIVEGFWATMKISILALLLGSLLGAVVCRMRMGRNRVLRKTAEIYVTILRNLPMLVLLLIMYYVLFAHSGLSATVVSILAFAVGSSAYYCEVFRTGIQSVDRGQMEAGRALGFSDFKAFFLIVAPQAAVRALPVYKNECISLLKGTAVVGYISVLDMTKASDLIRNSSLEAFFPLLVISVLYFLIAWGISAFLDRFV